MEHKKMQEKNSKPTITRGHGLAPDVQFEWIWLETNSECNLSTVSTPGGPLLRHDITLSKLHCDPDSFAEGWHEFLGEQLHAAYPACFVVPVVAHQGEHAERPSFFDKL